MDGKLLFCVSVGQGDNLLYGPEWKEAERGKSLIDLFLQVCGSKVLGQQVQVLVSKDREFLEAAVVQVCAPLSHLSERSQSYIKFIIKGDHQLSKNAFALAFSSDRDVTASSNYKQPQDLIASLCINDPLTTEKWLLQSDTNTLHSLTSKPAFENMTVEEICDEIRRIRKMEMSKNKLPAWIEDEKKHLNKGTNNNTDSILKETEVKDKGNESPSSEKSKPSPAPPKASLTKASPIAKKRPEVKRTASFRSNKSFKRLSETTRNKLNGKKHLDNRNKEKEKSALTKSTKAAASKNISERLSILAQPRKRHPDPNLVTSPTSNSINVSSVRSTSGNKRSTDIRQSVSLDKKAPSLERINKKACLTRGSTSNSTFIKMGAEDAKVSDMGKKNMSKSKVKKKETSQQYFVKIYTKDKPSVSSNPDSDTDAPKANSNLSKIETMEDLSKEMTVVSCDRDVSNDQTSVTSSSGSKEFSRDSLMNNAADYKSMPTMNEYTLEDFIPECISPVKNSTSRYSCSSPVKQCIERSSENASASPGNRIMSVDNLLSKISMENNRHHKRSRPDSLNFEDRGTNFIFNNFQSKDNCAQSSGNKMNHKNNEFVEAEKLEKNIVNLSREILNSSGNTSIENIIDSYFSPSPTKTPTKSPLFMHLLEKNNLKPSGQRSADTSFDDIRNITLSDTRNGEHSFATEFERSSIPKPGFVLPIRETTEKKNNNNSTNNLVNSSLNNSININNGLNNSNNSSNNSYNHCSNNLDNDKCSKIPINSKKSPLKSRTDENDKVWANSRGIKFMKDGTEKVQPLTVNELEGEDKPTKCRSPYTGSPSSEKSAADRSPDVRFPLEISPDQERPMRLAGTPLLSTSSVSTPCLNNSGLVKPTVLKIPPRTATPDRNRKVWGNSIDGMDTMLIPSLQAFSLELRTLSETVTSNLIDLYENFRQKHNASPDIATLDDSKNSFSSVSPKLTEKGGDQQGVATVFRNLRKIEGQMRTIEKATHNMMKAMDEKTLNQDKSPIKVEETTKEDLNVTRSLIWSDLRSTRTNSDVKSWLSEQERLAREFHRDSLNN